VQRRLLGVAGFVTGVAAATVLYRRRAQRQRERVDLYFADGSMVSLADGAADSERLLPLARSILATARR
jgi:hypothetical protein